MPKAIVCQRIEKIDGVTRTWFEWTWDGSAWVKTLVVEVEFNTDPNEYEFRHAVLDEIQKTARNVLTEETTMIVSHLKGRAANHRRGRGKRLKRSSGRAIA